MITIGVDIGSEFVKTVASRDNSITASSHEMIHRNVEETVKNTVSEVLKKSKANLFEKKKYFLTGDIHHLSRKYNKKSPAICINSFYSKLDREHDKLIIDAGNIYIDAYIISRKGKILDSFKNERCSAGCGRFLEIACEILGIEIHEVESVVATAKRAASISSGCIVFAESDIITLVNSGVEAPDILKGVFQLIASKISTMYDRYQHNFTGKLYLAGGLARFPTLIKEIEALTEKEVTPMDTDPWFAAAAGASFLE